MEIRGEITIKGVAQPATLTGTFTGPPLPIHTVTAFIDLVGDGYVELALELGIAKERIDTIVDFPATEKYGVKFEGGAAAASAATLADLAEAVAAGELVVPIRRSYPLDDVRAAFTELEAGHMAGKIVLIS